MISTSRGTRRREAVLLALACTVWVHGGCLGFDSSPLREPCVQGALVSCTCADRSPGTAMCLAGGRVGACSCEDGGSDGVFAGAGGGASGAGAGTSGPIVSGGAGGTGGTGGTTGDAGPSGGDAGAPILDAGVDTGVPNGLDASVTPPHPDLYKACLGPAECGGGLACAPIDTGMGPSGYCSELCAVSTDCTQPASGNAPAECLGGQCLLQCMFGTTCPDGMMCLLIPPFIVNGFCYY